MMLLLLLMFSAAEAKDQRSRGAERVSAEEAQGV